MARNEKGGLAITAATTRPEVIFFPASAGPYEVAAMHAEAHDVPDSVRSEVRCEPVRPWSFPSPQNNYPEGEVK